MSFQGIGDGAITAVATIAIAIRTYAYLKYSNHQWETMRRQVEDSANSQSAYLAIEDVSVKDSSGHATGDFRRNKPWPSRHRGRVGFLLVEIVPEIGGRNPLITSNLDILNNLE
jgi:hypothetical protein